MKSTGLCLSENVLFEWVAGSLAPEDLVTVEQHLDGCAVCREVLRNMTSLDALRPERGPLAESVPPLSRGAAVGRYLVVDVMGSGGMGMVYAAYDPELNRKVALKLLLTDTGQSKSADADNQHERLRREAQAMARLSHPNVVTVFDVGTADGQLFIAMELIEGDTLFGWLSAAPRTTGEILQQFLAAGRGLEAAHAAGFVHRDFKPANVLVGDDGRVCVTDFGLARLTDESGPIANAPPVEASPTFADTLTQTGMLVGTPLYMAPEQLDGKAADARSDQFSFCVALYEALYGLRPFVGSTVEELRPAILSGSVLEPARGRKVRPWLRRVLLRGLRANPAERYPSMSALLRDLGRDPAARRRRIVLVAAGSLALLLAGIGLLRTAQQHRLDCRAGAARLSGIWDAPTKTEIHTAFSRTGKPYAQDVWHTVERTLDQFASSWVRTYTEACEATQVRGEQSAELLDLRMDCLNRRLEETAALTSLFRHVDAEWIDGAGQAVQGSADLQSCADVHALRQRRGPPTARQERRAYDALERELARLNALENTGQFAERKTADGLVATAERLNHPVLLSDALLLQGYGRRRAGDLEAARESFNRAAVAAERAVDDGRVAMALDLVALIAAELRQPKDAARLLEVAAASSERAGKDAARDAQHLEIVAALADERGAYLEEAARCGDAAALYHQASYSISEATALSRKGWALSKMGQLEEGARICTDALGLIESTVGRAHPFAMQSLNCLANIARERNQAGEAVAWLRRALSITEATYDGKGPRVVNAYTNIGEALLDSGDYAEALSAFKKSERTAKGLQIDPLTLVCIQLGNGMALLGLDRASDAVPLLESGHRWLLQNSTDKDALARGSFALARALLATGHDRARALLLGNDAALAAAARPPSPYTRALRDEIDAWLRSHRKKE